MKIFTLFISLFITSELFGINFDPSIVKEIDTLIDKKLAEKENVANPPISDEVFLKRIYLNAIGRIPTLQEYETFTQSNSANKRDELIHKLIYSKGYTSHQSNKWIDTLRAITKLKKGSGDNYIQWIKHAIHTNMPYDQFVYELVTAEGQMYQPGNGKVGYYYRDFGMPLDNLSNTMALFNASSMACAQCHDHPKNNFSQMDFYKLAAYTDGVVVSVRMGDKNFARQLMDKIGISKTNPELEEKKFYFYFDGAYNGGTGKIALPEDYAYDDGNPGDTIHAGVPYGTAPELSYKAVDKNLNFKPPRLMGYKKNNPDAIDVNARLAFGKWLTSKENPMFTKTIVNRLFYNVMGSPLCGRLMDMKLVSRGRNPELTDFLIKLMKDIDYDQKLFMKYLYSTKAYQREMIQTTPEYEFVFHGPVMQRLSSEQLHDSILALKTDSPEKDIYTGRLTRDAAQMILIEQSPQEINKAVVRTAGLSSQVKSEGYDKKGKEKKTKKQKKSMMAGSMTPIQHAPEKQFVFNYAKMADDYVKKHEGSDYKTSRSYGVFENRSSELFSPMRPGSFLHIFGQSQRETPDDGNKEANTLQALQLMNDTSLLKFEGNTNLGKNINSTKNNKEYTEVLFRSILTREPTQSEIDFFTQYLESKEGIETAKQDLIWALLNSNEFKLIL